MARTFDEDGLGDIDLYFQKAAEKGLVGKEIVQDEQGTGSSHGHTSAFSPCYHDHPELKLGSGVLVGGSCISPRAGFDVYVGLDSGMHTEARSYPWSEKRVESVYFYVPDQGVPSAVMEYKKMVGWLAEQLEAGKRVHVGCIGGHGRTGTLVAAVVQKMGITKDAIGWVREHHCKKAVESQRQIDFLVKHFGCSPHKGKKTHKPRHHEGFSASGGSAWEASRGQGELTGIVDRPPEESVRIYAPAPSKKTIWR